MHAEISLMHLSTSQRALMSRRKDIHKICRAPLSLLLLSKHKMHILFIRNESVPFSWVLCLVTSTQQQDETF